MDLRIEFNNAELKRLHDFFASSSDMFNKARVAALSRTAGNMRKNIRKGLREVSYLAGRDLTSSIGKLVAASGGVEFSVTVRGSKKVAHKFRLRPNRITARKGKPSTSWQSPLVHIGPGEAPRQILEPGFSKAFIARTKNGRGLFLREKATGNLIMPKIVSPQYFAAFERVREPVLKDAKETFLKRLEHEIDYRLGLGK